MEIIPAIDLRHGQVVRLNQGDFDRQTTFSNDPLKVARDFQDAGATRIHVVDLDGAKDGYPSQNELYSEICEEIEVPVEVGGGFRTPEHVALAIEAGADRVVLGTAAVEDPSVVEACVRQHGVERIVVGLDANDGFVAVAGWREKTDVKATDLMSRMHEMGVRLFVYTDISRDGTLTSPNFEAVAAMIERGRHLGDGKVIASGGISSVDDLKRLAGLGAEGAILGSAIYRGTIELRQAIQELSAS